MRHPFSEYAKHLLNCGNSNCNYDGRDHESSEHLSLHKEGITTMNRFRECNYQTYAANTLKLMKNVTSSFGCGVYTLLAIYCDDCNGRFIAESAFFSYLF